jgi:tRNA-dihydrouridine synthase
MLKHLERNLEFYGQERGLRLFRKYASRYLTPYQLPEEFRKHLLTRKSVAEFVNLLEEITPFKASR